MVSPHPRGTRTPTPRSRPCGVPPFTPPCEPRPWPSPAATPASQRRNRGPEGEAGQDAGPPSGKWELLVVTVTPSRITVGLWGTRLSKRQWSWGNSEAPAPASPSWCSYSSRGEGRPTRLPQGPSRTQVEGGGSPGPAGGRGKDLSGDSKSPTPQPVMNEWFPSARNA